MVIHIHGTYETTKKSSTYRVVKKHRGSKKYLFCIDLRSGEYIYWLQCGKRSIGPWKEESTTSLPSLE